MFENNNNNLKIYVIQIQKQRFSIKQYILF